MVHQASKVVAKIVDLTNAAWNQACEHHISADSGAPMSKSVNRNKVVSPEIGSDLNPKVPLPLIPLDLDNYTHHFDLENGVVQGNPIYDDLDSSELDLSMSAENASAIVDYVISEIDTTVIMPPSLKRQRTLESS